MVKSLDVREIPNHPEARDAGTGELEYGTREVARLLAVSIRRLYALVRSGWLRPTRGPRGAFRFSFSDLVLVRRAEELRAQGLSAAKIRSSLERLAEQLPTREPLLDYRLRAEGNEILVEGAGEAWHPATGQKHLDFPVGRDGGPVVRFRPRKGDRSD